MDDLYPLSSEADPLESAAPWEAGDFPFDAIAQNIFLPIYGVIADDILAKTGRTQGRLLDIGCGGGHLGLALLERTACAGYFADINAAALEIAGKRAQEQGLADRAFFTRQDVHSLDFSDNFFDLIVSRSSYSFWEDLGKALLEIYRVLAPGGKTYIGGGLGNAELAAVIRVKMRQIWPDWPARIQKRNESITNALLHELLEQQGISHQIIDNPAQGRWIIMEK